MSKCDTCKSKYGFTVIVDPKTNDRNIAWCCKSPDNGSGVVQRVRKLFPNQQI